VTEPFALQIVPRYAEIDQQGVVFNGHYLTWFDEASGAFFDHIGVPYHLFMEQDFDVQVVHAELDYLTSVRFRDEVRVAVVCERTGTTSFTLRFEVLRRSQGGAEQVAVRGHNVYVVVSTSDWTKRALPDELRNALISVAAQGLPSEG
jgi:acyl-CoA thioester hydrolase